MTKTRLLIGGLAGTIVSSAGIATAPVAWPAPEGTTAAVCVGEYEEDADPGWWLITPGRPTISATETITCIGTLNGRQLTGEAGPMAYRGAYDGRFGGLEAPVLGDTCLVGSGTGSWEATLPIAAGSDLALSGPMHFEYVGALWLVQGALGPFVLHRRRPWRRRRQRGQWRSAISPPHHALCGPFGAHPTTSRQAARSCGYRRRGPPLRPEPVVSSAPSGQSEGAGMAGKFVVKKGRTGQFRFSLVRRNGQTVATSEAYTTKASCMGGIKTIKTLAADAEVEDQTTKAWADQQAGLKAATKAAAQAAKKAIKQASPRKTSQAAKKKT
jgi:uncharacterized protein